MSNPSITSLDQHISRRPEVCGGKACVAGSRIRVQDIYVWHELQGQSVDEIVTKFPQLTHADVYAALAHFWDNRQAILDEMKEGEELVADLMKRTPSKLAEKLRGRGDADPISS